MDNYLDQLPTEKRDYKAALLWGAVLLVLIVLLRGTPVNDVYILLVNIRDFIANTFVFLEATLDMVAYALMLLLLATLAFAVTMVSRAWGQRRRQNRNYC